MKKCPVCDKTFEDSMRFCQTDGTPLPESIEEAADDPFQTVVAPKEELDAPIPEPDDPFKTMVASSQPREDSGELLELPEDYDPLKTSVVSAGDLPELANEEEEIIMDVAPPSPFSDSSDFSTPPEPPQFEEPSLSPPSFGDLSGQQDSAFTEGATEIIPPDSIPKIDPFSSESSKPSDFSSPTPIPSPFGDTPSSYEKPSTSPYAEPDPPPTVLGANPFDQPASFGQQNPINQPFQQNEWTPPPAPVSNWQDQGLGANTPFQPPPAAAQGLNQTLPIISLVLGILSVCCLTGVLTGPAALITGFLGMKNANSDPNQYGGKGLAIAGMIIGGLFFLLAIVWWILRILGLAWINFN